jgi:predicted phosphoribosyltransferase
MRFKDRFQAGQILGEKLRMWNAQDVLVLALPRGGVPVGYEIARLLGAPLDILLVKKIGTPGHKELALGAVAEQANPIGTKTWSPIRA